MPIQRSNGGGGDESLSFVFLQNTSENIRQVGASVTEIRSALHAQALSLETLKTEFSSFRINLEALTRLVRDGNGQPSLVTRVAVLENQARSSKERQERDDQEAAENRRLNHSNRFQVWAAIIGAVISGILAAVACFK